MKLKLQFPRNRIKELLFGMVVFFSLSTIANSQENLVSALDFNYSNVPNQLDNYLSIKLESAKVKDLLDAIEGQSDLRYVYDKSVLKYEASFTLEEKNIRLYHLLQK